MELAAEIGIYPDTLWEYRPVDFWKYYAAYKKKERMDIRKLSLQMWQQAGSETKEQELFEDLYYTITETKRPVRKTKSLFAGKTADDLKKMEDFAVRAAELAKQKRQNG